jgi:hypothetical protein
MVVINSFTVRILESYVSALMWNVILSPLVLVCKLVVNHSSIIKPVLAKSYCQRPLISHCVTFNVNNNYNIDGYTKGGHSGSNGQEVLEKS